MHLNNIELLEQLPLGPAGNFKNGVQYITSDFQLAMLKATLTDALAIVHARELELNSNYDQDTEPTMPEK